MLQQHVHELPGTDAAAHGCLCVEWIRLIQLIAHSLGGAEFTFVASALHAAQLVSPVYRCASLCKQAREPVPSHG